jgi:predicted RNA-binding protein with PIN domain
MALQNAADEQVQNVLADEEKKANDANENANGGKKPADGQKVNYAEKYVKKLSVEEEATLKAARIEQFAEKLVNTDSDTLHIYVDGYNIIGVDRACRDFMYKTKQKQKARQRIAELLQHSFVEKVKLNYKFAVHLYFDGHIDAEYTKQIALAKKTVDAYKDIEVVHTAVDFVVDDKLVDDFSKVPREHNGDKVVITSDRELTLRLHAIGVASMKSGVFYKAYLKENHQK